MANNLLSLAEARSAIRLPATDTTRDADLTAFYIPSVEAPIVDLIGPVITTSFSRSFNGGGRSIVLDNTDVTIQSVTVNGVAFTDYTADLSAGILYRGTSPMPNRYALFPPGRQNVVVAWSVGPYANVADVPANIKLAARIILAHLWQADQQGNRPNAGQTADGAVVMTPSGFAIPNRAAQMLGRPSLPGFA